MRNPVLGVEGHFLKFLFFNYEARMAEIREYNCDILCFEQ